MKISRMTKGEWSKIRAFFDLETEDGFTLKGLKIVEGSSGLFVGMPSKKDKDGEYNDTIIVGKMVEGKFAPDKMLKEKLNKLAIDYYNQGESTNQSGSSQSDDIPF
tara:strand:+ start:58 stop:375 length:318 start_codon:yes stop_codon:yes gene_type:complete